MMILATVVAVVVLSLSGVVLTIWLRDGGPQRPHLRLQEDEWGWSGEKHHPALQRPLLGASVRAESGRELLVLRHQRWWGTRWRLVLSNAAPCSHIFLLVGETHYTVPVECHAGGDLEGFLTPAQADFLLRGHSVRVSTVSEVGENIPVQGLPHFKRLGDFLRGERSKDSRRP